MSSTGRVLIAGVYLVDQHNAVEHLAEAFGRSRHWHVEQSWIALGSGEISHRMRRHTVCRQTARVPKFTLINRLPAAAEAATFDYVVVCDDDIYVPEDFLDDYLAEVDARGFALAQPARTLDSYVDHLFVRQLAGIASRQTRFVEIGPLFSMRDDALRWLTPFSDESPMGWGYDFAWPRLLESRGLKLGVVDRTPVSHSLRKPVSHYRHAEADRQEQAYLQKVPHLSRIEAFTIVESFA